MRVLITGATGFIGGHVVGQIHASGHDILAFTLEKDANESNTKRIRWLYGDLGDIVSLKPTIKSFDPEAVIHLAWQGIPDYSEGISKINLNNSIQLLNFIVEETNCKKIITAGSCFEYGKDKGVCKESDSVQLNSFFSWAKYSLCQYLLLKCNQKGIESIWFRIFYVYGPGQRVGTLIPMLFDRLKKRIIPEIRYPFNANDFIYVGDVAEAFLQAVSKSLPSGIYNIGSGQATRVIDICKIIEKNILGGTEITERIRKSIKHEQKESFWADINKSQKLLDWKFKTTLEDGIAKYDEIEGRR